MEVIPTQYNFLSLIYVSQVLFNKAQVVMNLIEGISCYINIYLNNAVEKNSSSIIDTGTVKSYFGSRFRTIMQHTCAFLEMWNFYHF